jgi:hypothetical protein
LCNADKIGLAGFVWFAFIATNGYLSILEIRNGKLTNVKSYVTILLLFCRSSTSELSSHQTCRFAKSVTENKINSLQNLLAPKSVFLQHAPSIWFYVQMNAITPINTQKLFWCEVICRAMTVCIQTTKFF